MDEVDKEEYVMVTVVSSHRIRYVIPVSKLQAENPIMPVDPIVWAEDSVTCGEAKEFSQEWLGEQIVSTEVVSEDRMLEIFDEDNDYLSSWSQETKLEFVSKWKFEQDV